MVEVVIIEPIRYSSWISNPVIVRKKTGEIRICVDLKKIKPSFVNMEYLLKTVKGAQIMYMLDDFSGYNQVLVNMDDQLKNYFTALWGTYKLLSKNSFWTHQRER